MTERDDNWYRTLARLNAIENLLILLVMDRAAVNQDPAGWLDQYVANLRPERPTKLVGGTKDGVDLDRVATETHKAINEIADQIAVHGQIFKASGPRN